MSDNTREQMPDNAIIMPEDDGLPYIVRGAELRCTCGSHMRRLNLSPCHGVYVNEHPMVHMMDCKEGEGAEFNIPPFGVCSSPHNPNGGDILLVAEAGVDGVSPGNVRGKPCTPNIAYGKWCNTHPTTLIADNEAGAREIDPNNRTFYRALTMDSFLYCAYDGFIEPHTSGQENLETEGLNMD